MPQPVELTVSQIRQAIWETDTATHGSHSVASLLTGKLFHETVAGLLGEDPHVSWQSALNDGALEDYERLRRHAYEHLLGPRLSRHEAALREQGGEVLCLWQAVGEMCRWLCRILSAARDRGWLRYDEHAERWIRTERLIFSEEPLSCEFHEPGWRAPVRIIGIPDAVLFDPEPERWCCIEFKLGDSASTSDLAQAALYCALLQSHTHGQGTLALVRFIPDRQELLLTADRLATAQAGLILLAGRLAGVVGPKRPDPPHEFERIGTDLLRVLENFGLRVTLSTPSIAGPTFIRYSLMPGRTTPVKRIMGLAQDIGVQLGVATPMIQLEDGQLVVDIARKDRQFVPFSRVRESLPPLDRVQGSVLVPLGVDLTDQLRCVRLSESDSPHVLVTGTAGSGKSEWLRTAVAALLLTNTPETLRLVLVDPKRIAFGNMGGSPYLLHPTALLFPPDGSVTDELDRLIDEMEARYVSFQETGVDDISAWRERTGRPMPRIICIIDEFADIMADRGDRKQLEERVVRLGAKARAAGIHLILATQHPDAKTVTGRLQANLSVRVCLRTTTYQQSMVALKASGAERLLGKGDLFFSRGDRASRLQAPYLSGQERQAIFSQGWSPSAQ